MSLDTSRQITWRGTPSLTATSASSTAGSNKTALSLIPRCTTTASHTFLACDSRADSASPRRFKIPKKDWCEDLPIFYRFGWGGIESPEFRAAIVAAYRYAGMEDMAMRYEQWGKKMVVATVD